MDLLGGFRSLSPVRQLVLVGTVVALLGGVLVALYLTVLRTEYSPLFVNLRTMDAATIVAELDKKKVPYRLEDSGATILVPTQQVDATRLSVMSEDLPLKGTVGFELFNKSDMGLTEFAQKINYQRALQGELARTIMTMDGIESARVHLSLPDPTIFRDDRRPPKASITLAARAGGPPSPATVQGVRRLVAAAVSDLDPADVVILDEEGEVVSGDPAAAAPPSPALQVKQAIEQYYSARVRRAIDGLYPQGEVSVEILPPLDPANQPPDVALESWTPQDRRFRMSVTVAVPGGLAPAVQDEVRKLSVAAAGLHIDAGDVVIVIPATLGAPQAAPLPATPVMPEPARQPPGKIAPPKLRSLEPTLESPLWVWLALAGAVLVPLALVGGGLARRRRRRPRALTAEQRGAYSARLRALLEEQRDAAPTI